jgi:hypothetical protein
MRRQYGSISLLRRCGNIERGPACLIAEPEVTKQPPSSTRGHERDFCFTSLHATSERGARAWQPWCTARWRNRALVARILSFPCVKVLRCDCYRLWSDQLMQNVSIDIADRDGALLHRSLAAADSFNDHESFSGLPEVKISSRTSRASLYTVISADHFRRRLFHHRPYPCNNCRG